MFWNSERDAQLTAMWPDENMSLAMVGAKLGCSAAYCSVRAQYLGLPRRVRTSWARSSVARRLARDPADASVERSQPHFTFSGRDAEYVRAEARKRGLLVQTLLHVLVRTAVNDKMFDAILDDADKISVVQRSVVGTST